MITETSFHPWTVSFFIRIAWLFRSKGEINNIQKDVDRVSLFSVRPFAKV